MVGARSRSLLAVLIALSCLAGAARAHDSMVIGTSYSPPFSTPVSDGIFDLVVAEAFERVGLAAEMRMLPAKRSYKDANSGAIDGDVGRVEGVERFYPNLCMVPEPVLANRDFVAFSVGPVVRTDSWEALEPYNVAYVNGWNIFEQNTRQCKSRQVVESTELLFRLLDKGRADFVLSARLDGLAMAARLGIENVKVMQPPLASMRMYLYLNCSHKELLLPLAEALAAMKADGTYERLMQQALDAYVN